MGFVFYTGFVAAAFVPTFLVSRVIFRLTKRWEGSLARLVATNAASGAICVLVFLVAAEFFAGQEAYPWAIPVAAYVAAQLVWLVLDILTDRSRDRLTTSL